MPALTLQAEIIQRLANALEAIGAPRENAQVSATQDARFGDYQSNSAMVLAKIKKMSPRAVAAEILQHLDMSGLTEPPEIAGAGFLNFKVLPEVLNQRLLAMAEDPRLLVPSAASPQTIIIDFSSPNIAKPMHVGHIRSTILGDALTKIARFLGHHVITDNHIGDWGTQFGKVIHGWKTILNRETLAQDPLKELVRLYREVNQECDSNPETLETCRAELVALQNGDPTNTQIWKEAVELSKSAFEKIYDRLNIQFDEVLGESFYHSRLAPLTDRLEQSGIAEISDGALCIFFPDHPELADHPCLIRKSDGGFLYATTDVATLEFRQEKWNPDAVWYVTGAPQQLHFQQIFAVAEKLQITADLRHVAFGSILGEDRKLMKTRSGENVQLADVLDEAEERAQAMVLAKNPDLPEAERNAISSIIGIGAVKYAELSQHRMTDYVFSWDKMLSLQGNTAPYLQNAYVRIQSIFRKLPTPPQLTIIALAEPAEYSLAKKLLQFPELLPTLLEDFRPNLLANYLFELANEFHHFYEACPILKSEGTTRDSRISLCLVASQVLQQGLNLLGIQTPDRM